MDMMVQGGIEYPKPESNLWWSCHIPSLWPWNTYPTSPRSASKILIRSASIGSPASLDSASAAWWLRSQTLMAPSLPTISSRKTRCISTSLSGAISSPRRRVPISVPPSKRLWTTWRYISPMILSIWGEVYRVSLPMTVEFNYAPNSPLRQRSLNPTLPVASHCKRTARMDDFQKLATEHFPSSSFFPSSVRCLATASFKSGWLSKHRSCVEVPFNFW